MSGRKGKRKKWQKPKDKPSRPLSAYNLFFQFERSNMLGVDIPSVELENKKKRCHCKTHGKIGFAEMARAIGAKWKSLEAQERKIFEEKADEKKKQYTLELAAWKALQKEKLPSSQEEKQDLQKNSATASKPVALSDASKSIESSRAQLGKKHKSDSSPERRREPGDGAEEGRLAERNTLFLQYSLRNLEYIRALQDQELVALSSGLRLTNSPSATMLNNPSAAESSAMALLQHFQSVSEFGLSSSRQLHRVDALSPHSLLLHFPSSTTLTMQKMQFGVSGVRFYNGSIFSRR